MSLWRSEGAWPTQAAGRGIAEPSGFPTLPAGQRLGQGAAVVAGAGVIGGIVWASRRVVHPGVATAGSGSGGCGCFAPPGWTPPTVSTSCASCSACG